MVETGVLLSPNPQGPNTNRMSTLGVYTYIYIQGSMIIAKAKYSVLETLNLLGGYGIAKASSDHLDWQVGISGSGSKCTVPEAPSRPKWFRCTLDCKVGFCYVLGAARYL